MEELDQRDIQLAMRATRQAAFSLGLKVDLLDDDPRQPDDAKEYWELSKKLRSLLPLKAAY